MELTQALAIAAAALVMALTLDAPNASSQISARAEAAISNAIEYTVWQTEIRPQVQIDPIAYPAPRASHWNSCDTEPKAVRL